MPSQEIEDHPWSSISSGKKPPYDFLETEFIDLNNVLNALIKYLPAALIGMAAGGLLGLLISAFLPKTYQSATLAEFMPSKINKILNPLDNAPVASLPKETYQQYFAIAQSQAVMEITAKKLKAKGVSQEKLDFAIKILPSTNILSFEAQGKNADVVPIASWTWEESTIEFLTNYAFQNLEEGHSLLSSQYKNNKKSLEDTQNKIERIRPALESKKTELRIKNEQLLNYAAGLEKNKIQITNAQIQLPALKAEIVKHEKISTLEHTTAENDPVAASIYSTNANDPQTKQREIKMFTYGANPLYVDLEKKIAEYEIALETLKPHNDQLNLWHTQTAEEVAKLQQFISEQSVLLESLERDLQVAKKSYELIYGKLGESNFVSVFAFSHIQHLSPPSPATVIARWHRLVGIGALLGILAGLIYLYVRTSAELKAEAVAPLRCSL